MFQFPAFASYTLCIQVQIPRHNAWKPVSVRTHAPYRRFSTCWRCVGAAKRGRRAIALYGKSHATRSTEQISQAFEVGFPIRISMDQSLFAAPHGFSQRITSFFACACQGIHQMPLSHFFVLIANAHPCLIWKTYPLHLRSEGFQIWPYGQGFPCRLRCTTRIPANDKTGTQTTGLPFTTPFEDAIDVSIRSH